MRLLLDSHIVFWWATSPGTLAEVAQEAIESPENQVFVSSVSIWELGRKAWKEKFRIPENLAESLAANGLAPLSFTSQHAGATLALPKIHGDPFDRALVAQCKVESLTLISRDHQLRDYEIALLQG